MYIYPDFRIPGPEEGEERAYYRLGRDYIEGVSALRTSTYGINPGGSGYPYQSNPEGIVEIDGYYYNGNLYTSIYT